MISAASFRDWVLRLAWLSLALALAYAVCIVATSSRIPVITAPETRVPVGADWPETVHPDDLPWEVFLANRGTDSAEVGDLTTLYRLAGTFFQYPADGGEPRRLAVLDDLCADLQRIVGEGDNLADDVRVADIFRDRVVLISGNQETELWIRFAGAGVREAVDPAAGGADGADAANAISGAENRFGGRQIGPNRWVFSRRALMDYYDELRDEPERLVQVFDSLKPVRDDVNAITGYQLGIEGESAFFSAVGMREGDVVRSVNSLSMTNRRRAEFLIAQFVKDKANAFVLDIERDGRAQKLIYEVR